MKKYLIILTIITFNSFDLICQFSIPIQPWANDVENRVLVVKLEEMDEEKIKTLKKEGQTALDEYYKSIEDHNKNIQNLIPKYWPYKNKIEFKSKSDVEIIVKNKDTQYMILDCRRVREIKQSVKVYYTFKAYAVVLYFPEYGKKVMKKYSIDDNADGKSNFLTRGQYVFKVSMPDYFLNDRDLQFAFHQFKEFIDLAKTEGWPKKSNRFGFKIANFKQENYKMLKTKTLLIPKELLTISEEQIADAYHAPFKVVSFNDINALLDNDLKDEYAYYQIIWSDQYRFWTLVIIDNMTGSILADNPTSDQKFQLNFVAPIDKNGTTSSSINMFSTADVNFAFNEEHLSNLVRLIDK